MRLTTSTGPTRRLLGSLTYTTPAKSPNTTTSSTPSSPGEKKSWPTTTADEHPTDPSKRSTTSYKSYDASPTGLEADTDRVGKVEAVGVDETLFWRQGRWRTKQWCTSVVDVGGRQLIDIVAGRTAESAARWFRSQPAEWRDGIRWAVLDIVRSVSDRVLPNAAQVADPFHVIRLANQRLDEVRRRTQNETLGHRGRKGDPLYRIRRLLTSASERISDRGRTRLRGLLTAGDPHGEVRIAWHAKETVRASTTSTASQPPSATSSNSETTSKTNPAHPRSTNWAEPSSAGRLRSPTGTSRR